MAVPPFPQFHRPILEVLSENGSNMSKGEIDKEVWARMNLTASDMQEREPNGALKAYKRAAWALHYLKTYGGLVESPRHGHYQVTALGREFLGANKGEITQPQLKQLRAESETRQDSLDDGHPEYNGLETEADLPDSGESDSQATPDVRMDVAYAEHSEMLAGELLDRVKDISSEQFEHLVLDLLVKMGYGRGEVVGRSGDGGIDVVFSLDPLGLDKVYAQAKKWKDATVGSPDMQQFSGSLDPFGATRGVFITTSRFSLSAQQYTATISASGKLLRLINGNELAQLMIRHGVGVVTEYTYEIKKLDENYFADEV